MYLSSASATFSFQNFSDLGAFVANLVEREKRPAAKTISLPGLPVSLAARRDNVIALPRSSARALSAGETTLPQTKVDWALWCAGRGLRVFPAKWESPSRKKPLIEGWQQSATVDPDQIREWWAKWPDADIGVALGQGILVIDIDVKKGKPGLKSLAELGIKLDDTLCTQTWSGGCHQFYMDPDRYSNSGGFLPGLDCKSDGGLVLGPGSHGGLYKLLHDKPIAPLPEALKRYLTRAKDIQPPRQYVDLDEPENVEAAIRWLKEDAPIAVQDCNGNDQLYEVACELMRDRAISLDLATQLLLEHYDPRCEPSWQKVNDMGDFYKTVNSAAEHAKGDIGTKTRKVLFGDSVKHVPQPALPPHTSPAALIPGQRKSALVVWDLTAEDAEPTDWAWPDHFARGELNILAGLTGEGKSQLLLAIAAVITNGGQWPTGETCKRGGVLLVQAEDSIEKTVIPRALAAGVNLSRLKGMNTVKKQGDLNERMVQLDQDLEEFKLWFAEHPEFDTLMFDPLSAYLGKADSHKDAEVRAVLTPFAKFAADSGIMVIVLLHLNKVVGRSAGDRIAGAPAFLQIPRTFHMALTDPEDPDLHILQTMRKNITRSSGGISYRLENSPSFHREASGRLSIRSRCMGRTENDRC